MKKKKILAMLGILIVIVSIIGVSYAIWQITLEQSGVNIVNTGCFHITFTDKNPITLSDVYPVGDNQAKTLVPYEFTIANTCETKAAFQVNLEVLNTSTLNRLEYIKVLLNEKDKTRDSKILTQNEMVEPTIENAHLSYLLHSGVLKEKQEKTYEVRMWFDEDTPAKEEVMNKTLESKVSITTSYKVVSNKENMVLTRFDVQEGTLWTDDDPFLLYKDNYEFMKDSEEIVFQDTMNPIEGATPIDISANQDKSVLAYVEDTDYVKTTIQANGKIVFPNISASFFERIPVYSIVGLYNVDTSNVMDMSGMFADCHNLQNLDLSSFDTSSVIFMQEMFYNCERLHQLVLTNFNTENVNYMYGMFQNCYYLQTLDLSHFDTSEVLDMYDMFNGCEYLTFF